jgi:uncharacterized membrane protein YbhN (UPF0104 family)
MTGSARRAWLFSGMGSLVLLGLLGSVIERDIFFDMLGGVPIAVLIAALFMLQLEGVCSALRVRLLAAPNSGVFDCVVVTAWWVAALAVMPARLGELAGLHQLVRRLRVSAGAALNNLFMQRLYDGLLLLLVGGAAVAAQRNLVGGDRLMLMLLVAAALVVLAISQLEWCFAAAARTVQAYRHRRIARALLRLCLGGRHAAASASVAGVRQRLAALSLLKWLFNLTALALLIKALLPALPWASGLLVAVLFNLVAAIPLQTIGGIGIGEVTFTAALGWYGVDLASAAAAALVLRAVLIVAPLLFWAVVMVIERLRLRDTVAGDLG